MAQDTTPGRMGGSAERPARFFADAAEFGRWLAAHHETETELWMGLYRRGHPKAGLQWEEAVREAIADARDIDARGADASGGRSPAISDW